MVVRAILFDLDFTLWRVASPFLDSLEPRALLKADELQRLVRSKQMLQISNLIRGWGDEAKPLASDGGAGVMEFLDSLWREVVLSPELHEIDGPALLLKSLTRAGLTTSPERASAIWDASYVSYPDFPLELFDDTLATLEALRERGLKTAIVTNSPWLARVRRPDIDALGIGKLIDGVIASADAGYRKPHARIFEAALTVLGVTAAEAAMIGDEPASDVAGARSAGLTGIWKRNGAESAGRPQADYVIDNLSEILDLPIF